jgi:hypothetical protein
MSRRDYIAIAAIISAVMDTEGTSAEVREAIRGIASGMAGYFLALNSQFDTTKFLDACGCL